MALALTHTRSPVKDLNRDPATHLCKDPNFTILSFIDKKELCIIGQVNKAWNKLINEEIDRLWDEISLKHRSAICLNKPKRSKGYIVSHILKSNNEIVAHCQQFFHKLSKTNSGTFKCLFPANPRFKCSVSCQFPPAAINEKQETWFYLGPISNGRFGTTNFNSAPPSSETSIFTQYQIHISLSPEQVVRNLSKRISDNLKKYVEDDTLKFMGKLESLGLV